MELELACPASVGWVRLRLVVRTEGVEEAGLLPRAISNVCKKKKLLKEEINEILLIQRYFSLRTSCMSQDVSK